ncbi:MAG: TetR/AcrR family transcriptional regulator [Clostridiales bacterium]|jgi:AcrR family transcriptional regulator|nr:TetR/AcrR family transcriptional regulator [Clostridiales bacterium]
MHNGKKVKKQKIMEAAYQLFCENGYKKTKIADIAVAAGIGKGTVYEYFDSKEALLLSIFSSGTEEYLADCQAVIESQDTETEKLINLIKVEAECTKENGARIMKMSQMILDTSDGLSADFIKKMNEEWNKKYAFYRQILNRGIETGEFRKMDTDMAAVAIIGAVGSYLHVKYGVSTLPEIVLPFDVEALQKEEMVELLLRGIQN